MSNNGSEAVHSVPVRQCAGCGKRFPKSSLLRICSDGKLVAPDLPQKAQSRGIYVCFSRSCAAKALKSGRIPAKLGVSPTAEQAEAIVSAAVNAAPDAASDNK